MHQLAPDNKIDLNIVLKCHGYLCFFMCFSLCFLCALYGLLCAITLQFVIYLYHIILLIVCALYEHFSRSE